MEQRLTDLKRSFGLLELVALADAEDLRHRGSGRNRSECPGCRNGDRRGASIGESNGVGVWKCHRDERHRGTAVDFLSFSRSISFADAIHALERISGTDLLPEPWRAPPAPSRPPAAEV